MFSAPASFQQNSAAHDTQLPKPLYVIGGHSECDTGPSWTIDSAKVLAETSQWSFDATAFGDSTAICQSVSRLSADSSLNVVSVELTRHSVSARSSHPMTCEAPRLRAVLQQARDGRSVISSNYQLNRWMPEIGNDIEEYTAQNGKWILSFREDDCIAWESFEVRSLGSATTCVLHGRTAQRLTGLRNVGQAETCLINLKVETLVIEEEGFLTHTGRPPRMQTCIPLEPQISVGLELRDELAVASALYADAMVTHASIEFAVERVARVAAGISLNRQGEQLSASKIDKWAARLLSRSRHNFN